MEEIRECRFCNELICGERLKESREYFRCRHGRFDQPEKLRPGQMIPVYFAWSGIWRPNKTVAAAQKDCPHFVLHPQVEFITKAGRSRDGKP